MSPPLRVAVIVASLWLLACSSTSTQPDADVTPTDGGARGVVVVLDSAHAVSMEVGPDGGQLVAVTGSGTTLTLDLPPDAVPSPATVTLTPVERIDGLPTGTQLLAAVQLEPDGLLLWRPATLTLTPAPAADARLAAFQWSGAWEDVHLTPAERTEDGNGYVVQVTHFSGAGVGLATDWTSLASAAAQGAVSYLFQLATLRGDAAMKHVMPWYDAEYQARFCALMLEWRNTLVLADYQAAVAAEKGAPRLAAAKYAGASAMLWRSQIAVWELQYFQHRISAPETWEGPWTYQAWSGDLRELGLSDALVQVMDENVTLFDTLINSEAGLQEQECIAETEGCLKRPYLERALQWTELASLLGAFGTAFGPSVQIADVYSYCDNYAQDYVVESALGRLGAVDPDEQITVRQGHAIQLMAVGVSFAGWQVALKNPTWQSSSAGIASVHDGVVWGRSPGTATITATSNASCAEAKVPVEVLPLEPDVVVISGTLAMRGNWVNGCPTGTADCHSCLSGADLLTTYDAHYEVQLSIVGHAGEATATGVSTSSVCCSDTPEKCVPEGRSWVVNVPFTSFSDGHHVFISFDYTPELSYVGLKLEGDVTWPENGSPRWSGTATILPYECACPLETNFTLQ